MRGQFARGVDYVAREQFDDAGVREATADDEYQRDYDGCGVAEPGERLRYGHDARQQSHHQGNERHEVVAPALQVLGEAALARVAFSRHGPGETPDVRGEEIELGDHTRKGRRSRPRAQSRRSASAGRRPEGATGYFSRFRLSSRSRSQSFFSALEGASGILTRSAT